MKAEAAGGRDRELRSLRRFEPSELGAFPRRTRPANASAIRPRRHSGCEPSVRLPSRAPGATKAPSLRTRASPPLTEANLFSIPAGVPFAPTLARALIDGALIEGFPGDGGPLALADATIYVPTQRAAAALARALVAASGGASLILPRIAPLGAFEPSRDALDPLADDAFAEEKVPAAVGELARRMILARLTRAWGQALQRRDPRRRRRRAPRVRRDRAAAGGDEPGSGFRARGRPRRR